MPSELSRQLGDFRTKHRVLPVVQKVSFLFDPTRAAGLDTVSLALIARKSLLKLATVEPAVEAFEDLFDGTGKGMDFLSQEEHSELMQRLKRLLSFLSGHFKTLEAQQCLEYLIQKYQVQAYAGEELILFALPYHDTPLFGTLIKLIPFLKNPTGANASETRWTFLRNVHKAGSPLSRLALIRMCRSSQPVMTAIIEYAVDSLKYGAFNQPLLSFLNVLLLEVLSDFNSIKFDISIPLFSLCRICFKAAQHCTSAFFVGLSVATHIVCVAEVRDDGLTLLLTRAISVCPTDKFHALLMALAVVASRRESIPSAINEALAAIDSQVLAGAVDECVNTFNSDLSSLSGMSPLIAELIASAVSRKASAPAVVLTPETSEENKEPVDEEMSSASEEDDSSSDDELASVRKILTGLTAKGTKQERLAAIEKYASVEGATRHCIRLAALCDSVDGLATTMKHAKRDMGFVPTLISVIGQFKKSDPRLVLRAAFRDLPKIPAGAITEVANALGVGYAGTLLAVLREREEDFVISGNVWKGIACIAATERSQVSKSGLIAEWRKELLPENFLPNMSQEEMQRFTETFIEYANNLKGEQSNDADSVVGQLVCSIVMPNALTRQALSSFAKESMASLSVAERTAVVSQIVGSGSPALIKKLNEMDVSNIDANELNLTKLLENGGSIEGWTLIRNLVSGGCVDAVDWSECISAIATQSKPGPIACAAWKCLTAGATSGSLVTLQDSFVALIVDRLKSSSDSATIAAETGVMLESLLALCVSEHGEPLSTSVVSEIVSQLLLLVVRAEETISDTLVVTAQSVCESLLSSIDFNEAWTLLLRVMGSEIFADHIVAVQIRCMQLLASLVSSREDGDESTSKELGQVVLGLVDLISSSGVTQKDSWTNLSNSEEELSFCIEKTVTEFLLQCNLKKLDKFFRRFAQTSKVASILRVYVAVCEQGGEAVTLALFPVINDHIRASLVESDSAAVKKRKRNMDIVVAALNAVAVSCVEQIPEANIAELIESVSGIVGCVDDDAAVSRACNAIVNVASSEQIKSFTKLMMQRTTDNSTPAVQEGIVKTILALWRKSGEVMVPAITEVTVFLSALFNSPEREVSEATRALVKEIDRVTGEDIEAKLSGDMDD